MLLSQSTEVLFYLGWAIATLVYRTRTFHLSQQAIPRRAARQILSTDKAQNRRFLFHALRISFSCHFFVSLEGSHPHQTRQYRRWEGTPSRIACSCSLQRMYLRQSYQFQGDQLMSTRD